MADVDLYSASETSSLLENDISDAESLSENETTPTHTREQEAQEGSSTAAQAAKAIEAAEDSSPSATPDTPPAGPSIVRLPVIADEQTPVLDAGPAPPDYAAATAWRRAAAATSNDDGTTEATEDSPLLPQTYYNLDSAAHPPNYSSGSNTGAAPYDKKRTNRARRARKCLRVTVICGLTILLVVIVLLQVDVIWPEKPRERIAQLDHMNTEVCRFDRYSEYATFSFEDPGEFRFKDTGDYSIEMMEKDFPVAVRSGDVNLYAAPKTQQAAVEVWVSVATTDPWEVSRLRFVEGWDSLAMVTPLIRKSGRADTLSPEQCVHTWVGIFVQTNVTLDLLKISAGFMNVSLGYADPVWHHHRKGEDLRFQNLTVITDKHGNINAHHMDADRTHLKTLSGNISGIYALRDELMIESSEGAADVLVDPSPDGYAPGAPPWFTVRTNWNPIGFWWPIFYPPNIASNESLVHVETGYGFWDGLTLMSYVKLTMDRVNIWS